MGNMQVVNFMTPPRSYVVHNATDDRVEVQWNSVAFTLPPSDVVIADSPENSTRHSAKDSTGTYIPGTLVLSDQYRQADPWLGGQELLWSASEAIKSALGIDTNTGEANSVLAAKGLSLLPVDPAPELVKQVTDSGRKRYEEFRIVEAEQVVNAHEAANMTRKQLGMPEISGDERYITSAMVLKAHRDRISDKTRKMLNLAADYPPVPKAADADLDINALADKLLNNPEFAKVMKQRSAMATGRPKARKAAQV
jgi:hypothetical protein